MSEQAVVVFCFRCRAQGVDFILYEEVGENIRIKIKGRRYLLPNHGGMAECPRDHVTAIACRDLTNALR